MTITLSAQTKKLLEERMRSGAYGSEDELVHAALHALNELEGRALDDEVLDAIDRAEDEIERGEVRDWNDVRDQVRAKFLGP